MSALITYAAALIAAALSWFAFHVGEVALDRARAQTAADAAALAAALESAPGGGGRPEGQAKSYARDNGAVLTSCDCSPGAAEAIVEVAVGEVTATARAVFDASSLSPQAGAFDAFGLDPRLAAAVSRLVAASGGLVKVTQGYRSPEEQAVLWARALRRYGSAESADDWVARPGDSMHQLGLAVDLGGDLGLAVRLVRRLHLPLWRPMPHEPWHFELTSSRS